MTNQIQLRIQGNTADTIYVLEDGTMKVSGIHEALQNSSNFYSDFWKELKIV